METTLAEVLTLPALVFLVVVAGVLIAPAVAELIGSRQLRTRPSVLVVLRSGETIRGTLLRRDRSTVELGSAEVLGERPVKVDGRVYIDRANVAFVQRPDA